MNPPEYAVQIIWSREDGAFIAAPFELPGCAADGQTQEEALANLRVVIQEWIDVARQEGRDIPKPMSREDVEKVMEQLRAESDNKVRQQIEAQVNKLVNAAVTKIVEEIERSRVPNDYLYVGSRELVPAGFGRH